MTIAMTKEEIENIGIDQILKVDADDRAAEVDISRWAKRAGHEIVRIEKPGNIIAVLIRRNKRLPSLLPKEQGFLFHRAPLGSSQA